MWSDVIATGFVVPLILVWEPHDCIEVDALKKKLFIIVQNYQSRTQDKQSEILKRANSTEHHGLGYNSAFSPSEYVWVTSQPK